MSSGLRAALRRAVPSRVRRAVRRRGLASWPPRGAVRFGSLRRTSPISSSFGFDRGTPIDRCYIESFLRDHVEDIHGRVLEVGDARYTTEFGGGAVESVHVLNLEAVGVPNEIVDDLARPHRLQAEAYDCVICVQTLHLIYDVTPAVETLRRIVRPGGVVLATLPGISRISTDETARWVDYWRVTRAAAARVFGDVFGPENVEAIGYGNVLTSLSFLHGIGAEELRPAELDVRDEAYDLLVGVRARRGERPE